MQCRVQTAKDVQQLLLSALQLPSLVRLLKETLLESCERFLLLLLRLPSSSFQ